MSAKVIPMGGFTPADGAVALDGLIERGIVPEPDLAALDGLDDPSSAEELFDWQRSPMLEALHSSLRSLAAIEWLRRAREAELAKPVPPAAPPPTADEFIAARIEAAREAIEAADQRVVELDAAAKQAADKAAALTLQNRDDVDVTAEGERLEASLKVAQRKADALRRALVVLQRKAEDPQRRADAAKYEVEREAGGIPAWQAKVAPRVAELQEIGRQLHAIRAELFAALDDAQVHYRESKRLAEVLEIPPPPEDFPAASDARIATRNAIREGILDVEGNPREHRDYLSVE